MLSRAVKKKHSRLERCWRGLDHCENWMGGGGRFKWISCVCLCPLRYDIDLTLRLALGHGNTSDTQHTNSKCDRSHFFNRGTGAGVQYASFPRIFTAEIAVLGQKNRLCTNPLNHEPGTTTVCHQVQFSKQEQLSLERLMQN